MFISLHPGGRRCVRRFVVLRPLHPERICWGCEQLCAADDLRCGNEVVRAMHPVEVLGDDWVEWLEERERHLSERGRHEGPDRRGRPDEPVR